jgi:polysaccharide pyruvyl transferase WcaK-like protein
VYGSEADLMDEFIIQLVIETFYKTYFIARTREALKITNVLGINGHLGTEVAWNFGAKSKEKKEGYRERYKQELKNTGWDGKKPLLGVAVTNPFKWPLKTSVFKFIKAFISKNWSTHHSGLSFYNWSLEKEKQYNRYLRGIASAINKYNGNSDFHVVVISMDTNDISSCRKLQSLLKKPGTFFSSEKYNGYEMKELIISLSTLITSVYNGVVLSIDGKVPLIGVSIDEKLKNIFREIGQDEMFYFQADDPDLDDNLYKGLRNIKSNDDFIYRELLNSLDYFNKKLEQMGFFLQEHLKLRFKGIDFRKRSIENEEGEIPHFEEVKTTIPRSIGLKR